MAKELTCPHCKKTILPPAGMRQNNEGSLVCDLCEGVLFPVDKKQEDQVRTVLQGTQQNWQKKEPLPIRMAVGNLPACTNVSSYDCGY